jgi:hypothetical protein
MIAWLRQRLTYANVAATTALVLALGGTSYAALSLPRNSVGTEQIRSRAIKSRHVDNGSLRLADLGPGARRALRGQEGPIGPAGPPAAKYFAVVSAGGGFRRGNATHGGHTVGGSGSYTVGFAENVSGCAYSATLGSDDGSVVPGGRVTVTDLSGIVGVQTYGPDGNAADLPFHVIVAC